MMGITLSIRSPEATPFWTKVPKDMLEPSGD